MNADARAWSGNPRFLSFICAIAGAFVGFLMPNEPADIPQQGGIVNAIFRFEMNHINAIYSLGLIAIVYSLIKRKVAGRHALVIYGALGFVIIRLLLASLGVANHGR